MVQIEGAAVRSDARVSGRSQIFRTRQFGDARDFVRTFGTVVDVGDAPLHAAASEAISYAHPAPPPNCARDKVALFSSVGQWCNATCYQLSEGRTDAEVASCGNTTAAVAASYALARDSRHVELRVELPGPHTVHVDAHIGIGADGLQVRQTWSRVPFSIERQTWVDGRRCAVSVGALNNYLVVHARPGEEPADFPVAEAIELWHRFGLDRAPLLSRMAVVQLSDDPVPRAKFFTCGEREHPSAPLTGLAVLKLLSNRLGWPLSPTADAVATSAGRIRLPRVLHLSDATATVEFSPVFVDLDGAPAC